MTYTPEFQEYILSYLLNGVDGRRYLGICSKDIFDNDLLKILFGLATEYVETYNYLPSKVTFIQYTQSRFESDLGTFNRVVVPLLQRLFEPLPKDIGIVKDTIIEFVQYQEVKKMFEVEAVNLFANSNELTSKGIYDSIIKNMNRIVEIPKTLQADYYDNIYLTDITFDDLAHSIKKRMPCCFPKMNQAQAIGGFASGEVNVFVALPKAGKTTLLTALSNGYAKDGYKVLYVDTENGLQRMHRLAIQNLLDCTVNELNSKYMDNPNMDKESYEYLSFQKELSTYQFMNDLDSVEALNKKYKIYIPDILPKALNQIKTLNGQIKFIYFNPKTASTNDVKAKMQLLMDNHGFQPDIVVCDYFDNMNPINNKVAKERRYTLQEVYFNWKTLASEHNVCTFSVSQTNRAAVDKEYISVADIGEDWAKIANSDSVWALNRTKEEKANNLARISPLANRNGSDNVLMYESFLEMDNSKCRVYDIEAEKQRLALESEFDINF